jgi:hypothetical protein
MQHVDMVFFAYIDPGLGLLAWQALVAACLGLLFYLKKTRVLFARLFQRPFRTGKPSNKVPDKVPTIPK